jgi:HEPN domain-containing protein
MAGMAFDDWLSLAENDLMTAQSTLGTGQGVFLQIGLQCHQAIESILTASYIKHRASLPANTEGLLRIVTELPIKAEMDDRALQTLEWLSVYPIIESMGAQNAGDLAALLTEEKTAELLARTKELFEWIKSKL